jgi:hypothetical protein
MASERAQSPWWEPTWRRLVGSTLVLFLLILAFLVGRARAGADPGLARATTRAPQQSAPATNGSGADPGANGAGDNFGNAVPDQGGGSSVPGPQDLDPPSTHVS